MIIPILDQNDKIEIDGKINLIEYQTATTDLAYEHKDLPEEKTIIIHADNTFGNTAYINVGDDLIPRSGFNKEFPRLGITISKKGKGYHISGTSTSANIALYFTDENGIYQIEVPESYIGKTVKLLTFADSVIGSTFRLRVDFLDSNKANISKVYVDVAGTSNVGSKSVAIPSGATYMQWYLYVTAKDITFDNDFQVFAVFDENTQSVALESESAELQNVTSTNFITFPYKSTASYIVSLNEYIRLFGGGGTVSYLTPEDFGAVADGATDDSQAIAECLTAAAETKQTVIMAKSYYIESPIDITYSGLDIIINDIVYNGTDSAVKIHGEKNTLRIHSITSLGVGVKFIGDGNSFCCHNTIDINNINSSSHGIEITAPTIGVYQNTVRFSSIRAGGDNCYGICETDVEGGSWISEFNFYGGQISNCDWAAYNVGGNSKFYGIQTEEGVKGGYYITDGIRIIQPRFAEASRDGEYPYFKFIRATGVKIDTNTLFRINEIDLSDNEDSALKPDGGSIPSFESRYGVLEMPLTQRISTVGENASTPMVYTDKAYVWGKYLIMTPRMAYRKAVTTETLDTRLIGRTEETVEEAETLSQLPTKFVVDSIDTDIYLHESYCAFGFNEFEVEQANGFSCKVYDKLNNLIFDGTDKGDGLYKFKVYKDATYCASNSSGLLRRDFLGHYWEVTNLTNNNPSEIIQISEGSYETIETITLEEDSVIERSTEPDGTEYSFKRLRLLIYNGAENNIASGVRITEKNSTTKKDVGYFHDIPNNYVWIEIYPECQEWRYMSTNPSNKYQSNGVYRQTGYNAFINGSTKIDSGLINYFTTDELLAGTTVVVQGIRA